jgi:cytoskeletal protein RodZ
MPPPPKVAADAPIAEAKQTEAGQRKASRKRLALYGLLAALVAVSAIGGGVWFLLDQPEPPVIVRSRVMPPATTAPSPVPPASPAAAPASPAPTTPQGPISRAKATVAKVQAQHTDPTNEVIAAAAPPSTAPAKPAGAVSAPPSAPPAATTLVPGPAGTPPASATFKAWVQNAKVSGVRAGANPRVFIERTAYAQGDLVNPQLGIVFDGYDAETRLLRFKDASGAVVERRH